MKFLKNRLKVYIIILIISFGFNHVLAAEENVKVTNVDYSLVKALSEKEILQKEQVEKHRKFLKKQHLDKENKIRYPKKRRKSEKELLRGDMHEAVDDICLKYKTYPDVYAKTFDAIVKMTLRPRIKKSMNYVVNYCNNKINSQDLNSKLIQN